MKSVTLLLVLACAAPAAARVVDGVAAVVEGQVITLSDVEESTSARLRLGAPAQVAKTEALEGLIENALVDKEAKRLGILVTKVDAEAAAEEIRKRNNIDEQNFRQLLATQGLSWSTYLEQLRVQVLKVKVAGQVLRSRLRPEEGDLREYYLKHAADFCEPDQVRLKHLQVTGGKDAAEAARARIEAGEAPEAVALDLGGGKTYDDMGVLAVGSLSDVVRDAVKAASAKGISPVVELGGVCHIFVVAETKQGRVPPYEELSNDTKSLVRERYAEDKEQELYRTWIDGLKEKAKIERLGG